MAETMPFFLKSNNYHKKEKIPNYTDSTFSDKPTNITKAILTPKAKIVESKTSSL